MTLVQYKLTRPKDNNCRFTECADAQMEAIRGNNHIK